MLVLATALLALTAPALASVYVTPPEGAHEVTLLVCPTNPDCEEEADWVSEARPDDLVVSADSLLALNVIQGGDAQSRAETFATSLDATIAAFKKEDFAKSGKSLDDAQRALNGWSGTPTNQQLFNLYYLRAAVKLGNSKQAEDAFQQAASVAWNRAVTLPVDVEPYSSLYYKAVYDLLTEGLGEVDLEPVDGVSYRLDGIDVGAGPVHLSVYAGTHRLNAVRAGTDDAWRTQLKVSAFRTSVATAKPETIDDLGWLATGLVQAVDEHTLDPDLAALLVDWCKHYQIARVHILVAEPALDPLAKPGEPATAFGLRSVGYDPKLRRFSGE